jgi:hypothetical protein
VSDERGSLSDDKDRSADSIDRLDTSHKKLRIKEFNDSIKYSNLRRTYGLEADGTVRERDSVLMHIHDMQSS